MRLPMKPAVIKEDNSEWIVEEGELSIPTTGVDAVAVFTKIKTVNKIIFYSIGGTRSQVLYNADYRTDIFVNDDNGSTSERYISTSTASVPNNPYLFQILSNGFSVRRYGGTFGTSIKWMAIGKNKNVE